MLRNSKTLEGYSLRARDGEVGRIQDVYFDDAEWRLRYFVVDTGSWLTGRTVLIAPSSLTARDWNSGQLTADLTKEQVRNSPSVDVAKPVSRQHEQALYDYYTWPYYWAAPGIAGGYGATIAPTLPPMRSTGANDGPGAGAFNREAGSPEESRSPEDDSHLRSAKAVRGYHISATDRSIGHVEDIVIDDETWAVRCFVVDTRNWWPGKKVILSLPLVQSISWLERKVYVNSSSEAIKAAPEFDEVRTVAADYLEQLEVHYRQATPAEFTANRR